MNIRSVNPQFNAINAVEPRRVEGEVKTQHSTDRDANGRQEQGTQEQKRHLTQDEFDQCLKALENLPGLQSNGLSIRHEEIDDHRIVFIEDKDGKIIRRFSESDLWLVTRNLEKSTGHIFDKAA